MLRLLRLNRWFFVPYLVFLLIGGAIMLLFTRADIHLYMNSLNSYAADLFFKYFTNMGDGVIYAIAVVILLFYRYRDSITLILSAIIVTVVTRIIKQDILPDFPRPIMVLGPTHKLHLVDGIQMHVINSFPSGHSATAFGVFLLFAFLVKNNYLKFTFFAIALMVVYSRIYLSQHFLIDTYFGSLIGVLATISTYLWTKSWKNPKLDLSLQSLFKRKENDIQA